MRIKRSEGLGSRLSINNRGAQRARWTFSSLEESDIRLALKPFIISDSCGGEASTLRVKGRYGPQH